MVIKMRKQITNYRSQITDYRSRITKFPKVAIILLNWNGREDTIECPGSLKHITCPNYELLVVDNGSTDGSVECFRERYPGMEIIENGENLGYDGEMQK